MMRTVHLDSILRLVDGVPPSVHYVDDKDMPSAAQHASTVADWAWIMLNSEFQKDLERVRAIAFIASLEEAQALQTKIEQEKPEWVVYYLPADAQDGLIDTVNTDFRNIVIIMLPYLGSRLPIRRINQVLCPDTVQITLYEPTGERKEIRQVPLEWIDFLSGYACPRQSPCRIFYSFERAPDELERRGIEEFERQAQGSSAPQEIQGGTTMEKTQDGKDQGDMPKKTPAQTRRNNIRHNPQHKNLQKIRAIGTKEPRVEERRQTKSRVHTKEGVQLPRSPLREVIMQDCFGHWEMSIRSLRQSAIDTPKVEMTPYTIGCESVSSSLPVIQGRRDGIWGERQTPLYTNTSPTTQTTMTIPTSIKSFPTKGLNESSLNGVHLNLLECQVPDQSSTVRGNGNEESNHTKTCDPNSSKDGTTSHITVISEANPNNSPISNTYMGTASLANDTESEEIQYIGTQIRYDNPAFEVPNGGPSR